MQIDSMIASWRTSDVSKLNISDKGVAFIADYEKFTADVYICSGGKITIGYGHVVKAGEDWSNGITKTASLALFRQDLQTAVTDVQTVLAGTQMTQYEFDATVALVINIGRTKFDKYSVSDKIAASKSYAIVESAWRSIRKAGGVDNLGVMRRRYDETQIYFHNTYARTYHSKGYLYNY